MYVEKKQRNLCEKKVLRKIKYLNKLKKKI